MSPVRVTAERWSELVRLADELWEALCRGRDTRGVALEADRDSLTLAWSLREALRAADPRRGSHVRRRRSPRTGP